MIYLSHFAGLLYNEEIMLASQYLYFDYVVFSPEPGSVIRPNMTLGRAFLTNHRLLLLSAEVYQGMIRIFLSIKFCAISLERGDQLADLKRNLSAP